MFSKMQFYIGMVFFLFFHVLSIGPEKMAENKNVKNVRIKNCYPRNLSKKHHKKYSMVFFQAICGVFLPTVPHCFFFFCSTKTQVCCVFFSFVAFFRNSNHVMNHMLCNGKNAPVIKRTQKDVTKSA